MAVTDFNKIKKLDVASVSGTPTISKAVPIKITSGDDSTTGTGEIVLDWSNISDESDIAVYDENDNLLDYYFESFDATNEVAVVWVHHDWVRDGSTQAVIAYGNGDSDQSVSASTVFGKESDLSARYLFNESSGDLIDVSGNGNDGTVNGATQGESGIVGGAYSFDGTDDYVDMGTQLDSTIRSENLTIVAWAKYSGDNDDEHNSIWSFGSDGDNRCYLRYPAGGDADGSDLYCKVDGSAHRSTEYTTSYPDTNWHMITSIFENGNLKIYLDDTLKVDESTGYLTNLEGSQEFAIGSLSFADTLTFFFDGNIDDVAIKSTAVNSDYISADYDSTKSSPEFFSQQSAEETTTTPTVENLSVNNATSDSFDAEAEVTDNGGATVSERGFVYNTSGSPTTDDDKITSGSGLGTFSETIDGLNSDTTYYVRAYAINSEVTAYSSEETISTLEKQAPTVENLSLSNPTIEGFDASAEVTDEGDNGDEVTERGFVYNTSGSPNVDDDEKTIVGDGLGVYDTTITGLEDDVKYYVRGYAINAQGTSYTSTKTITTEFEEGELEKIRVFINDTEVKVSSYTIIRNSDSIIDSAKMKADPSIEGLRSGAKLNITGENGVDRVLRAEIQNTSQKSMRELELLGNGFELNNIKVEKVYPEGSTPEGIVEDVIDNFSSNLSFESTWTSGFSLTGVYIADGYAIDVIRDMINLVEGQLRIDPDDSVYFERKGLISKGRVLESGNVFSVDKYKENKDNLFNEVKVIGGFQGYSTQDSFTGDGSKTVFELSKEPASGVRVTIDGSEVDDYKVNQRRREIEFDSEPDDGSSITVSYDFNRPIVVFNDDPSSKKEPWGVVYKKVEAPWLETFEEARKYSQSLLDIYSYPLTNIDGPIPYLDFDIEPGESVRVIDEERGIDTDLVVNKVIYKDGETKLRLGTSEFILQDWQREVMDRIKTLERKTENTDVVSFAKLLRHFIRVNLDLNFTARINSPVDSFVLGHQTLGRLRSGFDMEADCSDNGNHGTWTGSGVTEGNQYTTDGYRLSAGVFNASDRKVTVSHSSSLSLSSTASFYFVIKPSSLSIDVVLFDKLDGNNGYKLYYDDSSGVLNFEYGDGSATETISSSASISSGETYVVMVSLDGSNYNFHVNDSVDSGTSSIGGLSDSTVDLVIDPSSVYHGVLDELRFYKIALNSSQYEDLKKKIQIYDDCVLYLSFDNPRLGDRSSEKTAI